MKALAITSKARIDLVGWQHTADIFSKVYFSVFIDKYDLFGAVYFQDDIGRVLKNTAQTCFGETGASEGLLQIIQSQIKHPGAQHEKDPLRKPGSISIKHLPKWEAAKP